MTLSRMAIALALLLVLGVPFALRPAAGDDFGKDAATVIVITPHVQQIRFEFERAFDRWHFAHFKQHARVDWRTPGGTTEILKQLEAQYTAAAKEGRFDLSDPKNPRCEPGTIGVDVALGGGSYDHNRLKNGISIPADQVGQASRPPAAGTAAPLAVKIPMAQPAGFSQSQLDEWFGENKIGSQKLYDPEQYWLGTALSSFGIVYNREIVKQLGLPEPRRFEDLTDPKYQGWVGLADPRQSGSITTTFEAILNGYGWDKGWLVLREMCANTRYFTSSSTRPPIDISAGEAAAGLAIDFYGRSQAQSILKAGQRPEESRVGYVDPASALYIDADPVTILRGGPHPEMARRFVEFCLSEEAQALWQFPALGSDPNGSSNPAGQDGERMGPEQYELRRMPVRREMYEKYMAHFIDKVEPFKLAKDLPNRGWRSAIGIMMGCFAIDIADEQRAAWAVLCKARADSKYPPEKLIEMERLFYAWPIHPMADGTKLLFSEAHFSAIAKDTSNWRDASRTAQARMAYTEFFRRNYEKVVEMGRE